ncbi:MAG: Holliday junction branch migration DNA helicase RuvB, partial [Sphingobacteriaceae bacterium]
MNENLNPSSEHLSSIEQEIEKVLRPQVFEDFTGQDKILENLRVFVKA